MPVHRTVSTATRSALALGTLIAALVLSPLATTAAQAAPSPAGSISTSAARNHDCIKTVYRHVAGQNGVVGIRVHYYCES